MLSQFAKTIKAALKSTKKERAVLRARSAVQRFPVLEWRQRTEDLHKRVTPSVFCHSRIFTYEREQSILASRKAAKSHAFAWDDTLDRDEPPATHTYPPSALDPPMSPGPMHSPSPSYTSAAWSASGTPGTPGTAEYSPRAPLFHPPRSRVGSQTSRHPLQTGITINEEDENMESATADYFGQMEHDCERYSTDMNGPDTPGSPGTPGSTMTRHGGDQPGSFLARANTRLERQITKSRKGRTRDPLFAPEADPFMAGPASPGLNTPKIFGNSFGNSSVDSFIAEDNEPLTAPTRNFDRSSRRQSSDSISAIMVRTSPDYLRAENLTLRTCIEREV